MEPMTNQFLTHGRIALWREVGVEVSAGALAALIPINSPSANLHTNTGL